MKLPTLPPGPPPTIDPPAFGGLSAIHLKTSDLDRSLRFYAGLLGLPLVRTEPAPRRRYFLGLGAALLILEEVAQPAGVPGSVGEIALTVPDLDALEAVRRRLMDGGAPVSGLEDQGYAYTFRFRDPVSGVILQAFASHRPNRPEDLRGDPDLTPTARELLGPEPS